MDKLEQKAEQSAFQHTVFMAISDIYSKLYPDQEVGYFLEQLLENKQAEKNRILNDIIHGND
mgnify:CR=1 FL=1